jgi:hypothetical protein
MAKLMFFWCVQNRGIPHRGCLADKINQPLEIDQNKKCWGSTITTMGLNSRQPPGKTSDFTISSSTELKLVFPTKKWGASEH